MAKPQRYNSRPRNIGHNSATVTVTVDGKVMKRITAKGLDAKIPDEFEIRHQPGCFAHLCADLKL